jgi:Ankyrin repeat
LRNAIHPVLFVLLYHKNAWLVTNLQATMMIPMSSTVPCCTESLYLKNADSICYLSIILKVKRLLDEGMDVNMAAWGPKSQGVTPLHLAAQGGHLKVMDELLERGADIDARTKGACGCMCLTIFFLLSSFLIL